MGLFDIFSRKKKSEPEANYWSGANLMSFDGEKTPYELGTPYIYEVDYNTLHARAWESFLKSDVIQNAIRKYVLWIIGSGLKLQSDPIKSIIQKKGLSVDLKNTVQDIEDNFRIYSNSKKSSYKEDENMHQLGAEALKTALLSGDCLNVVRYEDDRATLQIIDGIHVQTPYFSKYLKEIEERGNIVKEGIEFDKKGRQVAYYIYKDDFTFERIPAYGEKTRFRQAWMIVGLKYKPDSVRGLSLLSAVLETAAKLDRYKDATIGSAEENAKIPYTIEHNQFSDGENPVIKQFAQSIGKGKGTAPETDPHTLGENIASKIAQTTSKTAYNMPIGASLKKSNGATDLYFRDFFEVNIDIVYATLGISPEVAMDRFGGSYSSSRAALKSWEYKMITDRVLLLKNQFYKPFFDYWLNIEVLKLNIDLPGYIKALQTNDFMLLEAYRNSRFIGATVPHIDPLKEVNAERKKLGSKFDTIPLTTAEQSCEQLNTGDFDAVITKTTTEINLADEFIDEPEPINIQENE